MSDKTAIEWTDATWNPIVGCSKVSPGCTNCYAVGVTHRGMSPHHQGLTIRTERGTDWNGEVHRAPDSIFYKPLRWKRPRRIFVNSLSDLFYIEVDIFTIARIVAVMSLAPQHTFQVLTKRPKTMAGVLTDDEFWYKVALERRRVAIDHRIEADTIPFVRPLPNVWLGTSVESDRYAFRADHLRATPAAVRWISAEPLLGPLPSLNLDRIAWVVCGGESGPGARPMHPAWVRDLRDRCEATETAYLFKQWGNWIPQAHRMDPWWGQNPDAWVNEVTGETVLEGDPKLDKGSWAGVWRADKKLTGRGLDGRTWDGYPAGAP